jgi:predicted amidohydrolase
MLSFIATSQRKCPGPLPTACEKARQHGMAICGSLYERSGNAVHNTAPVISVEGEIVGRYRKTHLFDVPNRTDIRTGIKESDKVMAGESFESLTSIRQGWCVHMLGSALSGGLP